MKKNTPISRILALFTILLLAFALAACGSKGSAPAEKAEKTEKTEAEKETEKKAEAAKPERTTEAAEAEKKTEAAKEEKKAEEKTEAADGKEKGRASSELMQKSEKAFMGMLGSTQEFPVEGTYTLFGVRTEGHSVIASEIEMESVIELDKDGTGNFRFNLDEMEITGWSIEDDTLSVVLLDGASAKGVLKNGIYEMDLYGDESMILFYAQEGADTSAYELMTLQEFAAARDAETQTQAHAGPRLTAVWDSLDGSEGIHLHYDRYLEAMDSTQEFDVHVLNGEYYSVCRMEVSGYEDVMITFFRDGKAYNLYPKDMTGRLATETDSAIILNNPELMDTLVQEMYMCMQSTEYTEETADVGGETYEAEVYPKDDLRPQCTFCFDADGKLAFYIRKEDPDAAEPGYTDMAYTIHAIDSNVDTSLFDISGYTIE